MTERTRHTPGQWEVSHDGCIRLVHNEHGYIKYASPWREGAWSGDLEAIANGTLMAAAPDLLAACQEFVRKVEAGEARSTRSYQQMKAAISKATGEKSATARDCPTKA